MGSLQSTEYYNPLTGTYDYNPAYQSELEKYYYYRRMYSQYYPNTGYSLPSSYYNSYAQQYYQPSVYQSPYNSTLGYNYGSPYQQSLYNTSPYSYGTPVYGYTNSTYYPNYLQRNYM